MASWLPRLCLILLAGMGQAAAADDLADFNAAMEDAAAHNRVAIGYLRTDSVDLAVMEMERMRASWGALVERFGNKRPTVFTDNPRYTEILVDVPVRVVGAHLMLAMGRTDLAANALQAVRQGLSTLRRESGVEVLADCILDLNAAMVPVARWDGDPPDLGQPAVTRDVAAKADALAALVRRCDGLAIPDVRNSPAFRRLIDGTLNALTFIPKAIETRDNEMLHRVVGELRAFDNLLTFRYG